jgi:hypothetical protein
VRHLDRVTKDEVYEALAASSPRVDKNRLKTLKLPGITATKLDGHAFMALWQKIVAKLNLLPNPENNIAYCC